MLYPSIDSLMTKIDSKYSLVSVAAKRARQLQTTEATILDKYVSHKNVGKALRKLMRINCSIVLVKEQILVLDMSKNWGRADHVRPFSFLFL